MAKFKCNLCGFESEDAVVFASHILSAHTEIGETKAVEKPTTKALPEPYECEICGAKFTTPELLEEHYWKVHSEEMKQIEKELAEQGIIPPEAMSEEEKEILEELKSDENVGKRPKQSRRTKKESAEEA